MAFQRIAVAGASGNLGPSVIEKLVGAGFDVTILSRSAAKTNSSNPRTVVVDYSSTASVTDALRGHDAFVSLVPDHSMQPALVDAAIAAGVRRFIPSEFGSNVSGSARTAALPVFAGGKVKTQTYLTSDAAAGKIEWTLIVTGLFLDWALDVGFFVNVKGSSTAIATAAATRVVDGGDVRVSATRRSAIGDAVVGVLRQPDATRNRTVRVQEAAVTQNQLLAYAEKRKPGLQLAREAISVDALEKESYANLQSGKPENIRPAMIGFILVSMFNPECAGLWDEKNDNELLGVKPLSEAEVEEEVAKHV